MLNRIIQFSVKNKLIIGLFTIALILYGGYQATQLPIDAVPDITNNQVQIITVAPSFGATDIERMVTFPVEQASSNISGIQEIRSFSRFGLSLVTIVFEDGIDIYWARQQVSERLQKIQSQIPPEIGVPEIGPVTTGLGEIYQYVVRAKKGYESRYDETELRTIQDWMVRRQLMGVEGVAEVSSFGGKLKQYEIAVIPVKLQSAGVSVEEIFDAVEKNNSNTGGSYIEKGPTAVFIRSEGLLGGVEDIRNIAVKQTAAGTPVRVGDVAEVRIGYAHRFGAMCYNDEGEVSGAVVMMVKGGNSSQVIKKVKEKIELIQKSLPEGVVIEPFLDRTKMVNNAMSTVETNLAEGALIVLFVLILFLGNARAGLIVASVIPLAMLFAIILMNLFGVVGNLMSLGALDFGLIVDGAVFIVEAILHQLAHSRFFKQGNKLLQNEMDEEVTLASGKIARSVVFGQLIILIVYLPTFTLRNIEGKMFIPMAQTVSFALLGAFILSLTYVPMMSALVMGRQQNTKKTFADKMMAFFEKRYDFLLAKVMLYKKTTLMLTLMLFVFSVFLLSRMGGEFIPALEEGDFAVEMRLLAGTNIPTSIEYAQKAARILKSRFPEVEKVVTKIGNSEIPTDPMPMEAGDMMVILKDKSEWTSASSFPELAEKMSRALEDIPGISTGFQFPVQMRFNELMTGARQDVVCKIFGEDLDSLALYAEKLGKIVNTVSGTADVFVEPVTGVQQIIISYDRKTMAQYNLSTSMVNRLINIAFAGQTTGMVFEGEKRFDLVIRMDESARKNTEDVRNLLIPTSSGIPIRLDQIAAVEEKSGANQIQREDTRRRIVVGFNVRGRDVQSMVDELKAKTEKQIKLPPGYYITYGGAFENLNAAKARLMIAVPIALLLIYLLLYFTFGSLKQGLLIYSAIPLSAIGGILFLALRGMPFSISAGVGFIALFGVAVLNGIVLISEFNRLKSEGVANPSEIIQTGTRVKLRPVLMTTFVASLGFLPMALSNGSGAEVQRPLATVVIGGLLISTFLTLFVLPLLYLFTEKKKTTTTTISAGKIISLIVFSLLLLPEMSSAQYITLPAALDSAQKNNLSRQQSKLMVKYREQLKKSFADIPATNVIMEAGQVNSSFYDKKFNMNQSFSFPVVYAREKNVLKEVWNLSMATDKINELELKKSVMQTYCQIKLLREKEKLLLRADSLLKEYEIKTKIRLEKGETDGMENAFATLQRGELLRQKQLLQSEIEMAKIAFQLLLNTPRPLEPEQTDLKLPNINMTDSVINISHPLLQNEFGKISLVKKEQQLARAKLLPEFNAGFNIMSMRGTGADNLIYGRDLSFRSLQAGIGLPVFSGAQRTKIKALQTEISMAENNYRLKQMEWDAEVQKLKQQLRQAAFALEEFERTQLPAAQIIRNAANLKFSKGEINFLEWTNLVRQAIQTESSYLDQIQQYNEINIQLQYLNSK